MAIWRLESARSIGVFRAFDEDLALARVIRGSHDTLFFHPLNDRGGAVVADREAPLDVARRCLAVAQHDLHGLAIKIGAIVIRAEVALVEDRAARAFFLDLGGDGFE